eukprot:573113-Prymnesium_polylepis.1
MGAHRSIPPVDQTATSRSMLPGRARCCRTAVARRCRAAAAAPWPDLQRSVVCTKVDSHS